MDGKAADRTLRRAIEQEKLSVEAGSLCISSLALRTGACAVRGKGDFRTFSQTRRPSLCIEQRVSYEAGRDT